MGANVKQVLEKYGVGEDVPKSAPLASRLSLLPIVGKPSMPKEMPLGTRMIICGDPKTGKSTMSSTARGVLFLDFEDRLLYVNGPRISPLYIRDENGKNIENRSGLTYPFDVVLGDVKKGAKFNFILDWLRGIFAMLREDAGANVQTIVFSTLDSLLDMMIQAYIFDNGVARDARQDYKAVYSYFMPVLEAFNRLAIDQIYEAHTEGSETQRWLSLTPFVKGWITSHVELIGMIYTPRGNDPNRFFMANKPGWPTGKCLDILPEECPTTMDALYAVWRGENPEKFQPKFERYPSAEAVA